MFAGLSPVVPGVGVCGWILELCGVELQAQPLRNTLEKCQGQEMFPKSLHSQLTDKLPFPVPAPHHAPSCESLRNAEFQMWDCVGK